MHHLLLLPFLSYTSTALLIFTLTVLFKYILSLGWFIFILNDYIPSSMKLARRYVYSILGIAFMVLFGAGYIMNLYLLYALASLLLYWATMLRYSKIPKAAKILEEPFASIESRKLRHRAWLLTDVLLINVLLLSMHWDRFVLEKWRFIEFEKTFTYAYDAESFFTYPIFLF